MVELTIPLMMAYLLPSFIAIVRVHRCWLKIVACNLLLGWTVIGWIFAFGWSLTARESPVNVTERFHGGEVAEPAKERLLRR